MHSEKFADRLAGLVVDSKLSERAFAREVGLSPGGLRGLLHEGKGPTLETVLRIAMARGVSVLWLSTGEGPKHPAESATAADLGAFAGGRAPAALDAELLGRVVDRIAKVYREEGVRLADVDLGRLAAEKYAEIADLAGDPDEWPGFLDVVAARVRKAIRAAAADPIGVKREA